MAYTSRSAKEAVLARVRAAVQARTPTPHPGPCTATPGAPRGALATFRHNLEAAGGEVNVVADAKAARTLLADLADGGGIAAGADVPPDLLPSHPAPARHATLGVSTARAAAAETGSLILDSSGGRRPQLLPPTHAVLVHEAQVVDTLADAIRMAGGDGDLRASALAIHSGPSKSADIGQILVTGVHGPGRIVAIVLGDGAPPSKKTQP